MCDPILVTLLKMPLHYTQSSRENATPSSGTSPLTSYKEVTPPPPGLSGDLKLDDMRFTWSGHAHQLLKNKTTCSRTLPPTKEKRFSFIGGRVQLHVGYLKTILPI